MVALRRSPMDVSTTIGNKYVSISKIKKTLLNMRFRV